jgi:cell division protease FtsH
MSEKKSPPKHPHDANNRPPTGANGGNWFSRGWFWIVLVILLAIGSRYLFTTSGDAGNLIGLNQLASYVDAGNVRSISVQGDTVYVQLNTGEKLQTRKENDESLLETLRTFGVTEETLQTLPFEVESAPNSGAIFSWLMMLLPMMLVFAFFIFIMRQAGGGGQNRAMQFGRSRARKMEGADRPTVTFADVAGSDEAKQELQEVVEFLKEPQKFAALGARIPKGVLMVGSPGTGKTLLAKAVAGEAGVPFFASSGSEFVEMFVGVGASRVRDLFDQAKKNSPCIIFVDEIDAVGRHRGAGMGGGNDEREQTLNQILVEMDGFDTDTNIVIIAATNRPDILDPALLRPAASTAKSLWIARSARARGDSQGTRARQAVDAGCRPRRHCGADGGYGGRRSRKPGQRSGDPGRAAQQAHDRDVRVVESIERVMAGPARRSRVLDAEDRRVVAYHEAGHAIVMEELKHTEGVGKITIVSRGQALGYVMPLPEEDSNLRSRAEYEDTLAGLLAGRVAEELIFEEPTTSAANDLERVTKLAKAMVTRFGMSDVIGPMQLNPGESNPFMGMEIGEQRSYSEDVARKIDREVRRIVDSAYRRAREVLQRRHEQLVQVAETLLERGSAGSQGVPAHLRGRGASRPL